MTMRPLLLWLVCIVSLAQDTFQQNLSQGLTLIQQGKFSEAVEPLTRAANARPADFEPNYLLGMALSQSGRRVDAIVRLRAGQAARPDSVPLLTLLGLLYLQESYPLDAAEALEAANRQSPLSEKPALLLAEAWHSAFQFDRALRTATEVAARFPRSADAQFRWGYELETAGQFDEARSAFARAVEFRSDFAEAHLALGRLALREGQYDSAQHHLEKVLRLNPKQRQARSAMAKALVGRKEYLAAKDLLVGLIAESDFEAEPHLLLARIFQVEGDAKTSARERARFFELSLNQKSSGGMSANLSSRKTKRFGSGPEQ
jgi:Flp pilus assembly protein TadD